MTTTIGGVVVIAAAAWIAVMRGGVDLRNGLLFGTGVMLVLNGMLGLQRSQVEGAPREMPEAAPRGPGVPLLDRITTTHVLLVLALLEVVINRAAVPLLRPETGAPPAWHTLLDYFGLFLFYFTGVLAAIAIAQRCV